MIAFYYGLTGFACVIYYRRELFKSAKNFVLIGIAPVVGGIMLTYVFVKSCIDLSDPANSESGNSWFGTGPAARDRRRLPLARRGADAGHVVRRGPSSSSAGLRPFTPGSRPRRPPRHLVASRPELADIVASATTAPMAAGRALDADDRASRRSRRSASSPCTRTTSSGSAARSDTATALHEESGEKVLAPRPRHDRQAKRARGRDRAGRRAPPVQKPCAELGGLHKATA